MMATCSRVIFPIVLHKLLIDVPVTGSLPRAVTNFQRTILFNVLGTATMSPGGLVPDSHEVSFRVPCENLKVRCQSLPFSLDA
jgi:hypothetical protein